VEQKPRYPKLGDPLGEGRVEEWPERVRLAFE
jgi:DNA polymerase-3 subunit alpha